MILDYFDSPLFVRRRELLFNMFIIGSSWKPLLWLALSACKMLLIVVWSVDFYRLRVGWYILLSLLSMRLGAWYSSSVGGSNRYSSLVQFKTDFDGLKFWRCSTNRSGGAVILDYSDSSLFAWMRELLFQISRLWSIGDIPLIADVVRSNFQSFECYYCQNYRSEMSFFVSVWQFWKSIS